MFRPVVILNELQVLEGLKLTMDQFIDLCILCGCDYCDSIRGIVKLSHTYNDHFIHGSAMDYIMYISSLNVSSVFLRETQSERSVCFKVEGIY